MDAYGTTLTLDGNTIGKITDLDFSGLAVNVREVPAMDDATRFTPKEGGQINPGTLNFTLRYSKDRAATVFDKIGEECAIVLTAPDGGVFTGNGILATFGMPFPLDDDMTVSASLEISGPPDWDAGT